MSERALDRTIKLLALCCLVLLPFWIEAQSTGGGGRGTTINPTNNAVPYRSSSTAFGDSPLVFVDANTMGTGATNAVAKILSVTGSSGTATQTLQIASDDGFGTGTVIRSGSTVGGVNARLDLKASTFHFSTSGTDGFDIASQIISTYNSIATAGNGVASIHGATSQKAETASADTNVLTFTPPAAAGTYLVSATISVASATSGVISYTVSYKDSNGNTVTNIAGPLFQHGTAAPNTTFTTSAAGNYSGQMLIDIDNSATSIVVKWVGGGTTSAKMSATIQRLN